MLPILLFIVSASLVLITSLHLCALLKIQSPLSIILATFLFSVSNIVLTCSIAGAFHQLKSSYLYVLLHAALFLVTRLFWKRDHSPALPTLKQVWLPIKQFFQRTFQARELTILFAVICLSILFQLILIFIMPPNTHDSMTTHLSRIGYWLQNGSYFPFRIHNVADIYYPLNPTFQVLWTIVFLGNDTLAESSQFIAMLVCAIAIYGTSRLMDHSEKSASFNALLFLSFPVVAMQATTTQTDLFVAAMIACAFYFLASGFQQKQKSSLVVSSLAIALAIGSKQTAFFVLPGYLILCLFLWLKNRKSMPGAMRLLLITAVLFFLIFGGLTYFINLSYFHGFFGPPGSVEAETKISSSKDIVEVLRLNSLRLAYNSIDPSGLASPWKNYFIKAKAHVFEGILDPLHLDLEANRFVAAGHVFQYLYVPHLTEDEAWYGPLGTLLLLVAFFQGLIEGIKKKDTLRSGIVVTFLIYVLCILLFRPGWDPFQGRYFLSVVVLVIALLDISCSKRTFQTVLRYLLVLAASAIIVTTHLFNEGKPVAVIENNPSLIRESIWKMDRIEKMTVQNRSLRDPLKSISSYLPDDAVLGLCIDVGIWDYPFFREDFSQKIIPVFPKELVLDQDWLRENRIDFIVMNTAEDLYPETPDFLTVLYDYEHWKLLQVNQ
jgi:hypothetical protein